MNSTVLAELIEQLPEDDQKAVEKIIERLIIAHDPDYVLLTPKERKKLEEAERETETVTNEELKKELSI